MSQILLLILSLHTSFCSLPNRSDYVEELFTSNEDSRGDWSTTIYCNYDEYAIGYDLKVQGPRGVLDDTAANSLRLKCSDSETLIANLENTNGDWSSITCPNNYYIKSYSSKVEPGQAAGDDTSLNSISTICNDPLQTIIETSNAGQWGDWSDYISCSNNAAVCGFRQNVQANHIGDNSALQGVRFQCCSLPTMNPTKEPSISPSISPIRPTFGPTLQPSLSTITPSNIPSISPTNNPSLTPSITPSYWTEIPTYIPTLIPTINPTINPTIYPTTNPTDITSYPSNNPTEPEKRTDIITSGILQSTEVVFVENKLKEKKNNVTSIILIVFGIFVLLIICGCFYVTCRKSKIKEEKVHTELTIVSSLHSNLSSISREEQKQSVLEDVDFKVMENNTNSMIDDDDDDDDDDDIVAYCNTKGNDTKGNNNMEQQIVDTESDEMPENEDMGMELGNTTNGYDENIADDAFVVQDDMNNEGGTVETPINDEIIDNGHTVY